MAQGVDVHALEDEDTYSYTWPTVSKLKRTEIIKLVGQGMHIASFGAWIMYVLCNTRRRYEPKVRIMPAVGQEDEDAAETAVTIEDPEELLTQDISSTSDQENEECQEKECHEEFVPFYEAYTMEDGWPSDELQLQQLPSDGEKSGQNVE